MKIGGIEGNLEEYIAQQQKITLEEAEQLIKENWTVEKYAEKIGVPVDFLKSLGIYSENNEVKIDYYNENNCYCTTQRIYKNLSRKWVHGTYGEVYGLWNLKECEDKSYIVVTIGEESTIKLWLNGIQAIGKPKIFNLKEKHFGIINNFEKVYIINENNEHSIRLINSICENLSSEKIYTIDLDWKQAETILNPDNIHTFAKQISKEIYNEYSGINEFSLFNNILKTKKEKYIELGKMLEENLHIKKYANSLFVFNNTHYEKDSDKSSIKKEILKINENLIGSINKTLNYVTIKNAVNYDELDSDNLIFLNGMLNLKTKEFLPHSPNVFNIFRLNVDYIEKPTLETNSAVEEVLSKLPQKDKKALLQFIGYSVTNRTNLNTFCCVIGKNSKELMSILSDMLVKIIGIENICNIPLQKFNDKFKNDLIANKLLNIVNELPKEEVKDVTTFKNLVARDTIEIKCTGKETTYIKNVTKHIFFGSKLPTLKEGVYDERFFKQMLVIKFDEEITVDEEKLLEKSSLEYIISLAIKEYLEMLDNEKIEFANKVESDKTVEEYKNGNVDDSIEEFINSKDGLESCFEKNVEKVKMKDIYEGYEIWCEDNGYKPMMRKKLIDKILKTGRYEDTIGLGGYDCLKRKLDI